MARLRMAKLRIAKLRMAKKSNRQPFLVRGQVIFIPFNDNIYVEVRCKNTLHSLGGKFYLNRSARHESQQIDRRPSNA